MSAETESNLFFASEALKLSTSMAHQRHNPSALDDPKVWIVISVNKEKSTFDEILRRVLDTEVRKEGIFIDDCSTDGTRQILENMAARQANREASAPAQDTGVRGCYYCLPDSFPRKDDQLFR